MHSENDMFKFLNSMVIALDALAEMVGKRVAWLSLLMVFVTFAVVVLRYAFNVGSIAAQESITYLHAILFMSAGSYALQLDGHVRVDVFYRRFSHKAKALVNLLGTLFLLFPVIGLIAWYSLDYINNSWSILERSQEAGGIPALFLLKSLILVFVSSFFLQGVAEVLRNFLYIAGWPDGTQSRHLSRELSPDD